MSAYVYLLKSRSQPSFKIGKANDIWVRLKCIGGSSAYDIDSSHCMKFDTVDAAYRAERCLHRFFDGYLFGIDVTNRYDGDTEHFKIECFDRVVEFIRNNVDLLGGVLENVPAQPVRPRAVVDLERKVAKQKTIKQLRDSDPMALCEKINKLYSINEYLSSDLFHRLEMFGIYEFDDGLELLIAEGRGVQLHDWLMRETTLRGKSFGTGFVGSVIGRNHLHFADIINGSKGYLERLEMCLDELDVSDLYWEVKQERYMLLGHMISSMRRLSIEDVNQIFRKHGYLYSETINSDQFRLFADGILGEKPFGVEVDWKAKLSELVHYRDFIKLETEDAAVRVNDVLRTGSNAYVRNATINRPLQYA